MTPLYKDEKQGDSDSSELQVQPNAIKSLPRVPSKRIKQLITDARVDELEALIEKIECERPDCTTDHSNLRKKYVTNRIKELKENKR